MILGISLAAGTVYLGAANPDGSFSADPDRLLRAENVPYAESLHQFQGDFSQILREHAPHSAWIAGVKMYGNWTYRTALSRAALEGLMHAEAARLNVPISTVTPQAIAKAVGCSMTDLVEDLKGFIPDEPGLRRYWASRHLAFGAAIVGRESDD